MILVFRVVVFYVYDVTVRGEHQIFSISYPEAGAMELFLVA